MGISFEIAPMWLARLSDYKSSFVQVMARCCQATGHYTWAIVVQGRHLMSLDLFEIMYGFVYIYIYMYMYVSIWRWRVRACPGVGAGLRCLQCISSGEAAVLYQGAVSLTFRKLFKIISRKYAMPKITFILRISSWNFVHVPKTWLWAHVQSFSLKSS